MQYDAFISYSHAADGRLAPSLQSGLQRLAKPWYRVRALRVFRDETGLSTNPHLWSSIVGALDSAERFVLLASPEAASSTWVERELTHWLEHKSADRILPVLTSGEWAWDSDAGRLAGDAVPALLVNAFSDEPRHLDLRFAHDETSLDLRNSRFRSAIADLAAPMHGISKDDLEGEDVRQHRRARRLARTGVTTIAVLLIIAIAFGGLAVAQRNTARRATTVARYRLLVSQAQAALPSDRQLATLLAIEADRRRPSADTRNALLNAVLAEPLLQRTFGSTADDLRTVAGHRVVTLQANRGTTPNRDVVQVWDWQTGRRIRWRAAPSGDDASGPIAIASTTDGSLLAVLSRVGTVQMYSGRSLEPFGAPFATGLGTFPKPSSSDLPEIAFSTNGQSFGVSKYGVSSSTHTDRSIAVFSRVGDRWKADPPLARPGPQVTWFDFSRDGRVVASSSAAPATTRRQSDIIVNDVATGRVLARIRTEATPWFVLDWERRRVVIATEALDAHVGADALSYALDGSGAAPQVVDKGLTSVGYATLAFDPDHRRLGVFGDNTFQFLDARTLAPLPGAPVLHAGAAGRFALLDSKRVLLGSASSGPISLWDMSGTSVLATRRSTRVIATPDPERLLGVSTAGPDTTVTVYTKSLRALGAPIPIDTELSKLAPAKAAAVRVGTPLACLDKRHDRIATIALATHDLVVRDGSPPFRVRTRAAGLTAGLGQPVICAWAPDGRSIAIGTFDASGSGAPEVALYDVARGTLRFDVKLKAGGIASLLFSADSKTLFAGGPTTGTDTSLFALTGLDRATPNVRAPFKGAIGISTDTTGRRLVVVYPAAIRVFDGNNLHALGASIPLPGGILFTASIAPDGREAVVVGIDGWRLVDLDAGQQIGPLLAPVAHHAYLGARRHRLYVRPRCRRARVEPRPGTRPRHRMPTRRSQPQCERVEAVPRVDRTAAGDLPAVRADLNRVGVRRDLCARKHRHLRSFGAG